MFRMFCCDHSQQAPQTASDEIRLQKCGANEHGSQRCGQLAHTSKAEYTRHRLQDGIADISKAGLQSRPLVDGNDFHLAMPTKSFANPSGLMAAAWVNPRAFRTAGCENSEQVSRVKTAPASAINGDAKTQACQAQSLKDEARSKAWGSESSSAPGALAGFRLPWNSADGVR